MTKRMALLIVTLVALTFATCTGCAGIYVDGKGRVTGYAIGEAEATLERTAESGLLCAPSDQNTQLVGAYQPTVVEVTSPLIQVAPRVTPVCDTTTVMGYKVTVKGGKLGNGWFGLLTTAVLAYFTGGLVP